MYSLTRRALAEALGTAVLCLIGPGSVVAALTLAGGSAPSIREADLVGVALAFGFVIAAMVYAIGKVSGGHINPAVTLALAATGRFPWRETPSYWAGQLAGAVLGALGIWAVFGQGAVEVGMGQTHIAAAATTTEVVRAALAEAVGTGLLVFAILGIVDTRSPRELAGLVIGLAVAAIILALGPVSGASLNPARAIGPELVQAIAGGTTYWSQLAPVYVLPGLVGAVAAAFGYDLLAHPRHVQQPLQEAVTGEDDR